MNRRHIRLFVLLVLLAGMVTLYVSINTFVPAPVGAPPTDNVPPSPSEALEPGQEVIAEMAPPSPPEEIKPGRAVTREIWNNIRFFFDGKAGEVITLRVTGKTPGLDPHVTFLDPDYDKEAFDDAPALRRSRQRRPRE
jgi:hypothetical protein